MSAMADNNLVADDGKSEIVTQFLLNTCRLLQPTTLDMMAAMHYVGMTSNAKAETNAVRTTLKTGSVAELYIKPMLSCVGDIDIMFHSSDDLAIPEGFPPPTQLPGEFYSAVKVVEIVDSDYPCYVYLVLTYLLTENTDTVGGRPKYNSQKYGPEKALYTVTERKLSENHGPAEIMRFVQNGLNGLTVDLVRCVRCLSWPSQAADWPTRHRHYDWPDSATVDRVISNGCDVVHVAHPQCRQDEWMSKHQWRLSFSRAEIVLLNSWMPVQQIVYHMLRKFVKIERLTDVKDTAGTKVLSNYNIKTLMLWACELKPRSWWTDGLNVVRMCVELLHTLAVWLTDSRCQHYFIYKCNLFDNRGNLEIITNQLKSINEPLLSTWFINRYIRECAQLCPENVNTSMKLQNAVSAVVNCRKNTSLYDLWSACDFIKYYIQHMIYLYSLTARSCHFWSSEMTKIDQCLYELFVANCFLYVARELAENKFTDELMDIVSTVIKQFIGKRRYSDQFNRTLSLEQAAKLMKDVANNSSRNTVQQLLIEIELSKAYLYRALRCKDSNSDSICCLVNVYLAVLYYTTGQYQTAIDHCTLVTRSQDHSQCSSHVVRGEVLPKFDDVIDIVLGLAVFYQNLRTRALNQQETQHAGVFTTKLFAHYLYVMSYCQFTEVELSTCRLQPYTKYITNAQSMSTSDVLLLKSSNVLLRHNCSCRTVMLQCQKSTTDIHVCKFDTSKLIELLQQSAVEHLTAYRKLEVRHCSSFASVDSIVTTDFEALYAYKCGRYQQCLQLSTQNVRTLLYSNRKADIWLVQEIFQFMDNDLISMVSLVHIYSTWEQRDSNYFSVSQLTLSLYLTTQCQLKLHHSAMSLTQTLDYIEIVQRRYPVTRLFDHLTLKLCERKLMIYLSTLL